MSSYRVTDELWAQDRDHLAALVHTAERHRPTRKAVAAIRLRRRETCYGGLTATMVEERSRQGAAVLADVSSGQLAITSERLVFTADKNREWDFDKLQEVDYRSPTLTLLRVSNRQREWWVRLTVHESDQFRLLLACEPSQRNRLRGCADGATCR